MGLNFFENSREASNTPPSVDSTRENVKNTLGEYHDTRNTTTTNRLALRRRLRGLMS